MKTLLLAVILTASTSTFALRGLDSKDRSIGSTNQPIELRRDSLDGSRTKIKGEVNSDGDFRGKDSNGNRYRGNIGSDGSGKIKDEEGNSYKVKSR